MTLIREVQWVLVRGGTCRYGDEGRPTGVSDLLWTKTPVTSGDVGGSGDPRLPVITVNHAEARVIAERLGGRLPKSPEWEWMAAGPERRRFPWGADAWSPRLANLRGSGLHRPVPVGTHPAGATPDGMLDVAGNVWEWTATSVMGEGFIVRGGSFAALPLYAQCTFLNAVPAELRSPGIGLRVVRDP
jgi:iron(II)-dependent oxidoreductase